MQRAEKRQHSVTGVLFTLKVRQGLLTFLYSMVYLVTSPLTETNTNEKLKEKVSRQSVTVYLCFVSYNTFYE